MFKPLPASPIQVIQVSVNAQAMSVPVYAWSRNNDVNDALSLAKIAFDNEDSSAVSGLYEKLLVPENRPDLMVCSAFAPFKVHNLVELAKAFQLVSYEPLEMGGLFMKFKQLTATKHAPIHRLLVSNPKDNFLVAVTVVFERWASRASVSLFQQFCLDQALYYSKSIETTKPDILQDLLDYQVQRLIVNQQKLRHQLYFDDYEMPSSGQFILQTQPYRPYKSATANDKLARFMGDIELRNDPDDRYAIQGQNPAPLKPQFGTLWDPNLRQVNLGAAAQAAREKYVKFEVERVEEQVFYRFQSVRFPRAAIELAVRNATNPAVIEQVLSKFYVNGCAIVVVGPGQICNLVGRTLETLLPPGMRQNVLYHVQEEDVDCVCEDSAEGQIFTSFPPVAMEHYLKQQLKNLFDPVSPAAFTKSFSNPDYQSQQQHVFTNLKCKTCQRLRHLPGLIPGSSIQCINGLFEQLHVSELLELPRPVCVVDLLAAKAADVVPKLHFQQLEVFSEANAFLRTFKIAGRTQYMAELFRFYSQRLYDAITAFPKLNMNAQWVHAKAHVQAASKQYLLDVVVGYFQLNKSEFKNMDENCVREIGEIVKSNFKFKSNDEFISVDWEKKPLIVDRFYEKIATDNAQYYFYSLFCEAPKGQLMSRVEPTDIQEYFGADPLQALREQ